MARVFLIQKSTGKAFNRSRKFYNKFLIQKSMKMSKKSILDSGPGLDNHVVVVRGTSFLGH